MARPPFMTPIRSPIDVSHSRQAVIRLSVSWSTFYTTDSSYSLTYSDSISLNVTIVFTQMLAPGRLSIPKKNSKNTNLGNSFETDRKNARRNFQVLNSSNNSGVQNMTVTRFLKIFTWRIFMAAISGNESYTMADALENPDVNENNCKTHQNEVKNKKKDYYIPEKSMSAMNPILKNEFFEQRNEISYDPFLLISIFYCAIDCQKLVFKPV
ncbi:12794_t:CDS:2 [Acaulospora morrowiae]|uniref:12794_t:CDS:1 n=1 Tax=Acaulospora morrowiae TaxID=94023 RepID=A0A9N9A1N8_9GLOM|nr:12794_t:CDS:2 [Acaulospora morrowiae]